MFNRLKNSPNKILFKTKKQRIKAYSPPKPSSKCTPDWLKSIGKDCVDHEGTHGTVKRCMPFLDAVTSGYVLTAPTDIVITGLEENGVKKWSSYWGISDKHEPVDIVLHHTKGQFSGEPLIERGNLPLKLTSFFCIETPKGYSTLFTPVMNNHELRLSGITFLSAVVETDNYYGEVNLPFILSNFSGEPIKIEKGTPLVQLLPFKRENWEMEISSEDEAYFESNHMALFSKLKESYRKQFHRKKKYV